MKSLKHLMRFGAVFLCCLAISSAASADDLASIFQSMGDQDWVAVRTTAQTQANNNDTKYKSTLVESKVFEGDYTPTKNQVKLGVLSDDGVDVYIDNMTVPVLQRKDQGQHGPNLGQSLHKIPFGLAKGQKYHIKVDYRNKIYTPGGDDFDGITLFAYLGNGEVTQMLPNTATKVLISKKRTDAYPSNLQTEDTKVRIEATVQNAEEGQKIYFEVIDPDDLSSYEHSDPATPVDNVNDNKDPNKKGTLAYATFQNNCLQSRQVVIGDPAQTTQLAGGNWEVRTTLLISNPHAGDNYQVRATGEHPDSTKPFADQADLNGKYQTSGLLVAWKRIYLEIDRMYQKGATIVTDRNPDADVLDDVLHVDKPKLPPPKLNNT